MQNEFIASPIGKKEHGICKYGDEKGQKIKKKKCNLMNQQAVHHLLSISGLSCNQTT